MRRLVCVGAWCLAEGDTLPGGAKVVSVHRDPAADRVLVGTDDGGQRMLYRQDKLVVDHLSPGRTTARHSGWARWLIFGRRRPGRGRHRASSAGSLRDGAPNGGPAAPR